MNIGGLNSSSESQYAQLHDIVHGKINMGEVVVDKSGKFDKINNHEFVNWNFWKVSPAQNKATREAVFKLVSEHVKAKYGADANLLVPKIRSYLQLDTKNVEQKVKRSEIKVLMDVMDDQAYVDKRKANSQARTDAYNSIARTLSAAGLQKVRQNEILNVCYMRLLQSGEEIKGFSDKAKAQFLSDICKLVQVARGSDDAAYSRSLNALKNGIQVPADAARQNAERRESEFAAIMAKFGPGTKGDVYAKLSSEEESFIRGSLLGENIFKPIPYGNRKALADILNTCLSGQGRMSLLREWASKTDNNVPTPKSQPQSTKLTDVNEGETLEAQEFDEVLESLDNSFEQNEPTGKGDGFDSDKGNFLQEENGSVESERSEVSDFGLGPEYDIKPQQSQPGQVVKPSNESEYVPIPTGEDSSISNEEVGKTENHKVEVGDSANTKEEVGKTQVFKEKVEQKDSNKVEQKDSNKAELKDSNKVGTESQSIDLDALCDEIEKNKSSQKKDTSKVSESVKTEQTGETADLFAGHDVLGELHAKLDKGYVGKTYSHKIGKYSTVMKEALNDEKFLEAASEQVKDLKTGDEFKNEHPELWAAAINDSGKSHLDKNPFKLAKGYSANVAMNILMDAIKNGNLDKVKISLSIFADCTYCGCGIIMGWNTQEEATLRDFGLLLLSYFKKEGLVKQTGDGKTPKFEYVNKNGKQLSPAGDGFMVSAPLLYNSLQKINWPKKDKNGNPITLETLTKHLCLQFRSAASFDVINTNNEDVFGDVQYKSDFMKFFGGKAGKKTMTGREVATTQSFLKDLYSEMREALKGVKGNDSKGTELKKKVLGREMMMLFMFTDEFDSLAPKISLFGKTRSGEIKRLVDMVMKGKHTKLLAAARENYIKTMRLKIRMDILMAKTNGIKQVIGGPIGCGAFFNEPELMGQMYAEEFDKYADKDMEFLCPDSGKPKEEPVASFCKGFNDYFANRPKVADAENK